MPGNEAGTSPLEPVEGNDSRTGPVCGMTVYPDEYADPAAGEVTESA